MMVVLFHDTIKHFTLCIFFSPTVEDICEQATDVATLKKVKVEEIRLGIVIYCRFSCCFFCENRTFMFMHATGHYNLPLIVLYISLPFLYRPVKLAS